MIKLNDFFYGFAPRHYIPLSFKAIGGQASFSLVKNGSPNDINIKISTDGGSTWHDYEIDSTAVIPEGNTYMLSGDNSTFSKDANNYYRFAMSGNI